MSDLIDRQALLVQIDIDAEGEPGYYGDTWKFIDTIKRMPSTQPKTGKWINGHWDGDSNFRIDGRGNCWFVRECSNCHEEIKGKPTKYCPNCGARMLKEGEEHD